MRRRILTIATVAFVLVSAPAAYAGDPSGGLSDGGATVVDSNPGSTSGGDQGRPGDHVNYPVGSNSNAPVYQDYYTPACSVNGPPGQDSGALCMGAVSICKSQGQPGALYMQHWRRQISPRTTGWSLVGNVCRGAGQPNQPPPQITVPMVLDAALAAAPRPTAVVQPGARSYVNVPNNYYAEAAGQTVPVTVLGQQIAVTFTPTEITWDFGDGSTGTGAGVAGAAVGAPGAVEHAYARDGSYDITATSTLTVSFTAPGLGAQEIPGALEMQSGATTLPVGEIQTRVDATR